MSIWFVPRDAAARSMGADAVASALEARGETVIRNGSRGMLWMEPLVERADERHGPRVGWSNVTAGQIDAGLPDEQSDNFIGTVEELDYLAKQNRWIYERVGITDPVDPEDYVAHGGLTGLKNALAMSGVDVVQAVTDSGLRGHGGAGFKRPYCFRVCPIFRTSVRVTPRRSSTTTTSPLATRRLLA